jgi:hypothetical protein
MLSSLQRPCHRSAALPGARPEETFISPETAVGQGLQAALPMPLTEVLHLFPLDVPQPGAFHQCYINVSLKRRKHLS